MLQQALFVLKHGQRTPDARRLDLAEVTPDFATIDVEGHIVDCNPAARRILGLEDEAEPLDVHIADAHPAWANLLLLGEGIQTARLDGIWSGRAALRDRTGREIPVSEIILAHPQARGTPEYLTLIARDITAIKVAENALRASEQLYRRIVENAQAGIWIVDPDHRITFVNPALARCLGYGVDDMLGRSICAFLMRPSTPPDHRNANPPWSAKTVPACRSSCRRARFSTRMNNSPGRWESSSANWSVQTSDKVPARAASAVAQMALTNSHADTTRPVTTTKTLIQRGSTRLASRAPA